MFWGRQHCLQQERSFTQWFAINLFFWVIVLLMVNLSPTLPICFVIGYISLFLLTFLSDLWGAFSFFSFKHYFVGIWEGRVFHGYKERNVFSAHNYFNPVLKVACRFFWYCWRLPFGSLLLSRWGFALPFFRWILNSFFDIGRVFSRLFFHIFISVSLSFLSF